MDDIRIHIPDCKTFTGYKPCEPGKKCLDCDDEREIGTRILLINLGALGAVLMTTTLLPALKRKYPKSTINWLTEVRAASLLKENPLIDSVYIWNERTPLILEEMKFDVLINTDKMEEACALTNRLPANVKLGFGLNENGAVIPIHKASHYLYQMGLDDELKFKRNSYSYPALLRELAELDRTTDEYVLKLTAPEEAVRDQYLEKFQLKAPIIGINTGSSTLYPLKRLPMPVIENLIPLLAEKNAGQPVLLLGGLEDADRNKNLADKFRHNVINTPCDEGIRQGLAYMNICDVVISGDSLGMHMAIGLRKLMIVWFNVSCAPEIELYGRGQKITSDVQCSPCWLQSCKYNEECLDEPITGRIMAALEHVMGMPEKEVIG